MTQSLEGGVQGEGGAAPQSSPPGRCCCACWHAGSHYVPGTPASELPRPPSWDDREKMEVWGVWGVQDSHQARWGCSLQQAPAGVRESQTLGGLRPLPWAGLREFPATVSCPSAGHTRGTHEASSNARPGGQRDGRRPLDHGLCLPILWGPVPHPCLRVPHLQLSPRRRVQPRVLG